MRKIFTLSLLLLVWISFSVQAQFASQGNKTVYTFESLAEIEETGITRNGNVFTVPQDFTISPTDTLRVNNDITVRLGNLVTIKIEGFGDFTSADTAVFTRTEEEAAPKGIYFSDNSDSSYKSSANIRNITFEYGGVRCFGDGEYIFENCTFRYVNTKQAQSAIGLGAVKATVLNCNFISNEASAISSGSNTACSLVFKYNYLYDNTTANTNRPQINMSAPGDGVMEIVGNTIIGEKRTRVGGIAVSNLLGITGANEIIVDSNYVENCRYGITTNGTMKVKIRNNTLMHNNHDPNPNSGGSGISIYDTKGNQTVMITGNIIEGHHWGITCIGSPTGDSLNGPDVNLGKLDKNAEDYNPGLNVFKDNGNNGVLYDIYNNSPKTVYAQNNVWNVEIQDQESIETVVFHRNDDATLGEVIFMPAGNPSGIVIADLEDKNIYFDNKTNTLFIDNPFYSVIYLYSVSGKLEYEDPSGKQSIRLPDLPHGVYIIKVEYNNKYIAKKIIM